MTIKSLMKAIPEEYWDNLIQIQIPCVRPGDEGTYPLIQVSID